MLKIQDSTLVLIFEISSQPEKFVKKWRLSKSLRLRIYENPRINPNYHILWLLLKNDNLVFKMKFSKFSEFILVIFGVLSFDKLDVFVATFVSSQNIFKIYSHTIAKLHNSSGVQWSLRKNWKTIFGELTSESIRVVFQLFESLVSGIQINI